MDASPCGVHLFLDHARPPWRQLSAGLVTPLPAPQVIQVAPVPIRPLPHQQTARNPNIQPPAQGLSESTKGAYFHSSVEICSIDKSRPRFARPRAGYAYARGLPESPPPYEPGKGCREARGLRRRHMTHDEPTWGMQPHTPAPDPAGRGYSPLRGPRLFSRTGRICWPATIVAIAGLRRPNAWCLSWCLMSACVICP